MKRKHIADTKTCFVDMEHAWAFMQPPVTSFGIARTKSIILQSSMGL